MVGKNKKRVVSDGSGVVARDCSVIRQGNIILSVPDLTLTESRIGIVGRNGSGKSTMARLICGLVKPDSGSVKIGGINVYQDRHSAIHAVGILFQNPDHQIIFPTVEEEISFGLLQQGQDKQQAKTSVSNVLDRFRKPHWATRSVHTLSQGQRHLVCLMSVLAMQPDLIVLDEPFAGLDIPTTRALMRYLDGLEQQVIHISHDPGALTSADRILWMDQGKVVADGAPAQVLPDFQSAMEAEDAGTDIAD